MVVGNLAKEIVDMEEYPQIIEPTEGWVFDTLSDLRVDIYKAIIHRGPITRGRGRRASIGYSVETGPLVWSFFGTEDLSQPKQHIIGLLSRNQIAFSYDELLVFLQRALSNLIQENKNAIHRLNLGISDFKKRIADYEMEILKSKNSISRAETLELPDIEEIL